MVTTELNTLSDQSKIWIYQSPRTFSTSEIERIESLLTTFLNEWNSHGKDLMGAFEIIDNQFIIIAVDENIAGASGCSIDSSVKVIKLIGQELEIDLLNKSDVAYNNGTKTSICSFRDIKNLVEQQEITSSTQIFDLSITNISDFRKGWPKPASETWVSRYF